MSRSFVRAVTDADDLKARADMTLAATLAGMGFGNAGVHIPHANAYPVAGRVQSYRPEGYPSAAPLVPHGMAVALTAPAAFTLTFPASPDRHLRVARLLDPSADAERPQDVLPNVLRRIIGAVGVPTSLAEIGYVESDIAELVHGALAQVRLLALAPLTVGPSDLADVFRASL